MRVLILICMLLLPYALCAPLMAQEGFFDQVQPLSSLNTGSVWNPVPSSSGLELFFGVVIDRKWDIWRATREISDATFDNPTEVTELNTSSNEAPWSLSPDGCRLYFDSERPGAMLADLFVSERPAIGAPFRETSRLEGVSSAQIEWFPSLTADEREICFMRSETFAFDGERDLYLAVRSSRSQPFSTPIPLSGINTAEYIETAPRLSHDGLWLFFTSNRPVNGIDRGFEIWIASRTSRFDARGNPIPFSDAVVLGEPVNSGGDWETGASVSPGWPTAGSTMYFQRFPTGRPSRLYQATWHPDCNGNAIDDEVEIEARAAADRNGNGVPDECEELQAFRRGDGNGQGGIDVSDAIYILNWLFLSGPAPTCLASANANSDGAIDVSDPTFLLNHLFLGGPPPASPFPECETSGFEADEVLGCRESSCQ